MASPRRSLPNKAKPSGHSLRAHALSEGGLVPQKHSLVKTPSRNSSYKNMSTPTLRPHKTSNSKSIRLSEMMAAMYPGLKIGHKYCVEKVVFVPKTMGWLWNTEDTATGVPFPRGWRPGAIALGVRRRNVRSRSMSEPLTTPAGSKGKRTKKKGGKSEASSSSRRSKTNESSIAIDIPPTLCIQKEHGVYHVKMHPIKKGGEDQITEEEQPVQFKIADSASSRSQSSKSTSSSLKIEYLCTGALRKPVKKPDIAEIGTQWETADFEKKEQDLERKVSEEKKGQKKGKKKKSSAKDEIKNK